ncbi:MAG: RsmE family RNA methyltransferase [Candidatus Omnitrophica bacterium]|nr:RsmE family RNA methyltransferase [Candidatus Omnitrophota bacterium]MDD5655336.1 RsmE family RNA methyltransferase [Candidatus Omnitrophota bacterium]
MQHIYCPKEYILAESIIVSAPEQAHYLCGVLRLRPGEDLVVFDGEGEEYLCRVDKISPLRSDLKIIQKKPVKKAALELTIACAIPKKSKMDDIIDKLTQLGVQRIIPMFTDRVNVEWGPQQKQKHLLRWRKIGISASEQSGRAYLPDISEIMDIEEVLAQAAKFSLKLIPTLLDRKLPLREVLNKQGSGKILVLIGPEGDFTPEEIELALKNGCAAVSLGDLTLRVETAAVAVAGYIRLYNEDR